MPVIDRDERVFRAFDAENRERILALVTPELVAEHAENPRGIHSDVLQRVLSYFRRGPIAGKYVVVAEEPFERYRIGVLSGVRGTPIEVLDDLYETEIDILHAIFLRRLKDVGAAI